jgi:hypothetical protein
MSSKECVSSYSNKREGNGKEEQMGRRQRIVCVCVCVCVCVYSLKVGNFIQFLVACYLGCGHKLFG